MQNTYNVTFIGQHDLGNTKQLEEELENILYQLISEHSFVEFYIGMESDFDIFTTSVLRRVRAKTGKERSALNLFLPYRKANMDLLEEAFDSVMISPKAESVHYKRAITVRNYDMIDQSDCLVSYTLHEGNAKKAYLYAKKQGKRIISL